jgi:hypothetical protein
MALRRDRPSDPGWTVLPVTGRTGPAPEWPLTEASDRELELWAALWAKPQAVAWEVLGQEITVALYVRRLAEVEQPRATASLTTLVRQLADSLGLTIPGMRSLRWHVGAVVPPATPPVRRTGSQKSVKERLKIVDTWSREEPADG